MIEDHDHASASVLANRHHEVLEMLHRMDMRLAQIDREIEGLREEADRFCTWMQNDSEKSAWYYDNRSELVQLVESSRWVRATRKAVAWLIGAAAGALMAAQQLEIWLREHFK